MPIAKDPLLAEFYVYHLVADEISFYVGIGRAGRASDRVRFVRYLIAREAQGKPTKWSFSTRVIALLLRSGCNVEVAYQVKALTRMEALEREKVEINSLLSSGHQLANIQHNRHRVSDPEAFVRSLRARLAST